MKTFKIGDKVYYRTNFGRGPEKSGVIVGTDEKNGQLVYDVDLERVPEIERRRWGYADQFRKR